MLWKICRVNLIDLKYESEHLNWSEEQKIYKENIVNNGYNPRISIIKISKDNQIIDGYHRVESVKIKGDKKIIVIKINLNFWTVIVLYIILFLITSPIWLPVTILKKNKKWI